VRKPAIGFIFITLMLDVMGFGLLIPVGPKLIQSLQGGSEADAAHAVGYLAATYAAMQFFFAPTLGALSDRFGRRPVLLIALFGSGLDYFAMALSPVLWLFFITRAVNGISGASMTVASAYIADVTPPEKRAAGFGLIGAAFGLGFVIGPLVGGFLGAYDLHWPFYAAGTITLINWLYGYFVVPESLDQVHRRHFALSRANPVAVFRGLGRYPVVLGLAGVLFFVNLAQFGLHATWVLSMGHKFGWTPRDIGWSLFTVGIGAAVVQAGLARRVIPLLGEKLALLVGLGLAALSYVGYGSATHGWMIYVVILVGSLAGIAGPAAQSMITRSVRPDEQGAVQGALTGLQSIANILGPLIGSWVFAYFIEGRFAPPRDVPGAPFYSSAVLCAIGFGIAMWAEHIAPARAASEPELHGLESPSAGERA
jgi:DHA1 family tetracycline resistance protein-like MFS transporter